LLRQDASRRVAEVYITQLSAELPSVQCSMSSMDKLQVNTASTSIDIGSITSMLTRALRIIRSCWPSVVFIVWFYIHVGLHSRRGQSDVKVLVMYRRLQALL